MAGKCESKWISMTLPRTETTVPRFDGLLLFFMFAFTNLRLGFAQPFPRLPAPGMVEVSDGRFGERLAERRHAGLPLRVPYHRKAFDVAEVFHVELDVLPQRAAFPAVETGHVEQQAQFSVLPDKSLELRHKVLIVRCCQLPADVNDENLAAAFFIELNGHSGLRW